MERYNLEISKVLKSLNKMYKKNYTLNDISKTVKCSRENLSRLTTDSSFRNIYNICECLYDYYPEFNNYIWDFTSYAQLLSTNNQYLI